MTSFFPFFAKTHKGRNFIWKDEHENKEQWLTTAQIFDRFVHLNTKVSRFASVPIDICKRPKKNGTRPKFIRTRPKNTRKYHFRMICHTSDVKYQ